VNGESKTSQHQALLQTLESRCDGLPLCQVPTDIVMGQGNLDAEIMFIGEAPGQNESEQRIPFVGRAGKLLNKTLLEVGLKREDTYVSNIVKVRPPDNRDPLPEEIAAFTPFLLQEIEMIQPKLICTLGRFSMNYFLPEAKISQVHGKLQRFWWHDRITYLLPQYHPAAAFRNGKVLLDFRADLGKIQAALKHIETKQEEDAELQKVRNALI
jgi:uracil-DNA glycosylase family 4